MPYKSIKQERFFNANKGKMAAQGVDVDEWNKASKGLKLPTRSPSADRRLKPKSSPANMRSESHTYDQARPKRQIVSRYK